MSTIGQRTIFPQKVRQKTVHGVMTADVWARWHDRRDLMAAEMGLGSSEAISTGDVLCSFVLGLPETRKAMRHAREVR
jgi:hypothetical protein